MIDKVILWWMAKEKDHKKYPNWEKSATPNMVCFYQQWQILSYNGEACMVLQRVNELNIPLCERWQYIYLTLTLFFSGFLGYQMLAYHTVCGLTAGFTKRNFSYVMKGLNLWEWFNWFLDMCKWPKNFMKTPEEIQTGCIVDEFYFLFFWNSSLYYVYRQRL